MLHNFCTFCVWFGHIGYQLNHTVSTPPQHDVLPQYDVPPPEAYYDQDAYIPPFQELLQYGTQDQVITWLREWKAMQFYGESEEEIQNWYEDLKTQYAPKLIATIACPKLKEYYLANWTTLPQRGKADREGNCQHLNCYK